MYNGRELKDLLSIYKKKRSRIRKRLKEFKELHKDDEECLFGELCFCLLTPQSNALYCDEAIQELKKSRVLYDGRREEVRQCLKKVRFPNNKTSYLLLARGLLNNGNGLRLRSLLDQKDVLNTREWLVKNVKGLGFKEASHFLRNVGLGEDLAILDVHILKNLKRFGIIKEIPVSLSRKSYLEIEERLRKFSEKVKIPMAELDLLFWSNQTGFIFK